MKIHITQNLSFSDESNIKVCQLWLSITEPDFIEEESQKFEYCNHQIKLPKNITDIFDPKDKKVISILSIDKNKRKKLVSHFVRS